MAVKFKDRTDAGRQLAAALSGKYADLPDVRVFGLPRGGVPVASEVARLLNAPLDILVVRKLGVPQQPEYAMGAIASGGIRFLDHTIVDMLGISQKDIDSVVAAEQAELARREEKYRGDRPRIKVKGCTAIVVDDGMATGATMRAAIAALRHEKAGLVVVAVPVAPPETCEALSTEADEIVCLSQPVAFQAVGLWYATFSQTSDEEVQELLERAHRRDKRRPQ